MTAASPVSTDVVLSDEALVELGRSSRRGHLSRWGTTGALSVAFVVVAFGALALPAHRPLSLETLLVTMVCYALSSRVHFEFGGGHAIPTQAIFVVMWLTLPPRLLPLVVCGALLAGALPEILRRQMPLDRLALSPVNAWHAVGPALVLLAWAPHAPRWSSTPVYVAALAAQLAFDGVAGYLVAGRLFHLSVRRHLAVVAPAYAVDVLLAPLGLLVAFPVSHRAWSLFLVLPVLALFSTFAKERQHRIDHALELSHAYRGTAILLGDVIEADDAYTGSHSRDVVELVLAVSDRLALGAPDRRHAEFAALLHDVGKVKIPSELINKPGPLDDDERALMNTHTLVGEAMLEQVGGLLGDVGRIVRSCHERWDGAGYPDGLAGEEIPLAARIVCACDAWSAMTTDRAYRKALPLAEATAELRRCAGTHFDPRVVDALVAVLGV